MSANHIDRERAMIALAIAAAPALTTDQLTKLRAIFRPEEWVNPGPAVALHVKSQDSTTLRRAA